MAAKLRPGPKPKGPYVGKRHPLNMRTTAETRQRIEAAAAKSGRSMCQEVEYRLGRSFRDDNVVQAVMDRLQPVNPFTGMMGNFLAGGDCAMTGQLNPYADLRRYGQLFPYLHGNGSLKAED